LWIRTGRGRRGREGRDEKEEGEEERERNERRVRREERKEKGGERHTSKETLYEFIITGSCCSFSFLSLSPFSCSSLLLLR
jgi:hypothetical protein